MAGKPDIRSSLKKLPSVEKVLRDPRVSPHAGPLARPGVTRIVRETIARHRARLRKGTRTPARGGIDEVVTAEVLEECAALSRAGLRRVINATGVVLHTNLGRAVLGEKVRAAIDLAARGYSNLEIDLESGERTERGRRAHRLLALLTGAEDALVVNNNAAAILLAVDTFAGDGAVAISRGELVEIGGSFRLPEILSKAAGRVIEVGTTNRTHARDYERAIRDGATLILKVHASNYRVVGFTNEVPLRVLAELGAEKGVPVMYDQGSGILVPLGDTGVAEESVGDAIATGVDLVSFSTDKVLGGPQGGALAGTASLIARMKENQLARALRVDKLTLAGLEELLLEYWRGEQTSVPALAMMTEPLPSLRARAESIRDRLAAAAPSGCAVSVGEGESSIGGGSYPINPLPTVLVRITLPAGTAAALSTRLRAGDPAVVVRVKGNVVSLDPRTIQEHETAELVGRLRDELAALSRRE